MTFVTRMSVATLLGLALAGCGPSVSDTGFGGTWRRETPSGPSVLSLRETADGWSAAWRAESGDRSIRCDDDGVCDELVEEQVIYRWRLSVGRRTGDDALFVTRTGAPVRSGTTALTEVLRCELAPGGLELVAHVVERNGAALPRPAGPYRYVKIDDDPRGSGR